VDDDCLVEPQWGQGIVDGFTVSSNVGMVFGRTRPYYPPEPGKRTRISIKDWTDEKRLRSRVSLVNRSAGMGGNMAVSRKSFQQAGPFDEGLDHGTDLPGAGDYEMSYRILKCGWEVIYTPSAVCEHKKWLAEEDYLKTERGYSMARAAALAKHAKSWDGVAIYALLCEFVRRLMEVPYHILITRDFRNVLRAILRATGFVQGAFKGFLRKW
jgi:GT2 family glycosyltransferase